MSGRRLPSERENCNARQHRRLACRTTDQTCDQARALYGSERGRDCRPQPRRRHQSRGLGAANSRHHNLSLDEISSDPRRRSRRRGRGGRARSHALQGRRPRSRPRCGAQSGAQQKFGKHLPDLCRRPGRSGVADTRRDVIRTGRGSAAGSLHGGVRSLPERFPRASTSVRRRQADRQDAAGLGRGHERRLQCHPAGRRRRL